MSREILFRGKRREVGAFASEKICEWIYGGYVKDAINTYIYDITRSSRMVCVDPETVCQCTGTPDKNNKNVYEGDIVRRELFGGEFIIGQVVWFDIGFCGFYLKSKNSYYPIGKDEHTGKSKCDEVIGNIFDNPELLAD